MAISAPADEMTMRLGSAWGGRTEGGRGKPPRPAPRLANYGHAQRSYTLTSTTLASWQVQVQSGTSQMVAGAGDQ